MQPDPQPLDLLYRLPRHVYWQITHTLQGHLPPPVDDTPEALSHRDHAAIAEVAAMLPANADEARLAAQIVSASAHADDCLRLALVHPASIGEGLKCRAQATSMMRQALSARRMLMQLQAERRKREANPVARDQAEWTEHSAAGLMAQSLPGAAPEPLPPEPLPPEPEPAEEADGEPVFNPVAAAEEYAMIYPQRAALIRRLGRLPDKPGFGPPEARLVRALVATQTPRLLALDQQYAAARAA